MKTIKVPKGKSFRSRLIKLGACDTAVIWVGRKSLRTAWRQCDRPDWMLWLAASAGIDRRMLVYAACQCARLSLVYLRDEEVRPIKAIEVAEAWCDGKATLKEVSAASLASSNAFVELLAKGHRAAAYAADAAAYAADSAMGSVDEAANATWMTRAAAVEEEATYEDYLSSTKLGMVDSVTLRVCSNIVRFRIPVEAVAAALEGKR